MSKVGNEWDESKLGSAMVSAARLAPALAAECAAECAKDKNWAGALELCLLGLSRAGAIERMEGEASAVHNFKKSWRQLVDASGSFGSALSPAPESFWEALFERFPKSAPKGLLEASAKGFALDPRRSERKAAVRMIGGKLSSKSASELAGVLVEKSETEASGVLLAAVFGDSASESGKALVEVAAALCLGPSSRPAGVAAAFEKALSAAPKALASKSLPLRAGLPRHGNRSIDARNPLRWNFERSDWADLASALSACRSGAMASSFSVGSAKDFLAFMAVTLPYQGDEERAKSIEFFRGWMAERGFSDRCRLAPRGHLNEFAPCCARKWSGLRSLKVAPKSLAEMALTIRDGELRRSLAAGGLKPLTEKEFEAFVASSCVKNGPGSLEDLAELRSRREEDELFAIGAASRRKRVRAL